MHSFAPDRTDRCRLIIDTRYQPVAQDKDKRFFAKAASRWAIFNRGRNLYSHGEIAPGRRSELR